MSGLHRLVDEIPAVDGHAHVGLWDDRAANRLLGYDDLRLLFPRAMLLSAAAPAEQLAMARDPAAEEPWRETLGGWADARDGCYYERLQERAYAELWGASEDMRATVDVQRERSMLEVYDECLRRAGLSDVLVNLPDWPEPFERYPSLHWVPYIDQFVFAGDNEREKSKGGLQDGTIGLYEKAFAATLEEAGAGPGDIGLDALLELADVTLERWRAGAVPCVKLNCGYVRSLRFDYVPTEDARRIWATPPEARSVRQQRALQDHIARFVIARSARHGLPIQVHAAVGDTPGLLWSNASPVNLEPLFADPAFGGPTVVLLHGGFPASQLAGWYAATYANVYLDYSWLPILSDVILSRCLEEWLDYVPYTKLLFGTDAWSPELFYGGTVAARRILADVLARRVEDGRYLAALAESVAECILAGNARTLYALPRR